MILKQKGFLCGLNFKFQHPQDHAYNLNNSLGDLWIQSIGYLCNVRTLSYYLAATAPPFCNHPKEYSASSICSLGCCAFVKSIHHAKLLAASTYNPSTTTNERLSQRDQIC